MTNDKKHALQFDTESMKTNVNGNPHVRHRQRKRDHGVVVHHHRDESWDHGVAGSCANRVLIGQVSSSRDHAVAQHYGNDLINMQRTAHTTSRSRENTVSVR